MTDTKSLLTSKTFAGVLLVIISALAPMITAKTGYTVTAEDGTNLVETVSKGMELFGAMLALYGRVKATKKIG